MASSTSIPSDMPPILESPEDESVSLPPIMEESFLNFFQPEEPYSTNADQIGLQIGSLLVEHPDLIKNVVAKRKDMENDSGLPFGITYFKNWAGNLPDSNGLRLYLKPKNIDEVQSAIKVAKKHDVKVGCGGSYHSWSPLFPDKCSTEQMSLLINNRGITLEPDGVIEHIKPGYIRVNKDTSTVTIVPGVTVAELMEVFLEHDICFESDVVLMGVTYGGTMTTGCHGVGKDQSAMSDWITQIKIVDHNGVLKTFPDDSDTILNGSSISPDDLMNAVKASLGVLGIVVEMTVKVKKMTTARVDTSYPTLGSLIYGEKPTLLSILRNNWSVEIFWFPYNSLGILGSSLQLIPFFNLWQPKTDQVWVRAINQDEIFVEANKLDKMKQRISETLQHKLMNDIGSPVLSDYGFLTPVIVGTGFDLVKATHKEGITYEPLPYAIHFRYGVSLAPVYDMEFAFPFKLDKDDDHCLDTIYEAMRFVVETAKKYADGYLVKKFPLSTTMEMRIIKQSETLLCPATKRSKDNDSTHTAYLEILSFGGTKNYQDFFKEVGEKWMSLGGVPHWSKQWTFLEEKGIVKHIQEFYGENLDKFKEVLKLLNKDNGGWDDIFVNSSMKNVLGLNQN